MTNILVSIAILACYTLVMIKHIGKVPDSLSASVFWLSDAWKWVWCVVLFAVCFLSVPVYLEKVGENTQFLAFIAIVGLAFVGGAPLVKRREDNLQFQVHQWGAIVCAFCSQLVLVFNFPWLLLCWTPWMAAFVWITKDHPWRTMVFWGEMVCFASTFAYCLI